MKDEMTVEEAFEILKSLKLTKSIQVVRLWVREGKIKTEPINKYYKSGYRITKKALEEFILYQKLRNNRVNPEPLVVAMKQLGYKEEQINEILQQTLIVLEQK